MNDNQDTIWDLNLPEMEEATVPMEPPTFDAQMAHAIFLLQQKDSSYFEERLKCMNTEPFRWID